MKNKIMAIPLIFLCYSLNLFSDMFPDYSEEEARDAFGFSENMTMIYRDTSVPRIEESHGSGIIFTEHYVFISDDENNKGTLISAYFTPDSCTTYFRSIDKLGSIDPEVKLLDVVEDTAGHFLQNALQNEAGDIYLQYGAFNGWNKKSKTHIDKKSKNTNESKTVFELSYATWNLYFCESIICNGSDTVLVSVPEGIYKSESGGDNPADWSVCSYFFDPAPFLIHGIEKAKLDDTYFVVYRFIGSNGFEIHVAYSTDYGNSWETSFISRLKEGTWFDFEFIDKDTWLIAFNDDFKPDPHNYIFKSSDRGKSIDTIFNDNNYTAERPVLKVFGENADRIALCAGNRCTAVSCDGGNTFEILIDRHEVVETDYFDMAYQEGDIFYFWSRMSGYLMMYRPASAVKDADIAEFKTKLYPNPAGGDSKIYLSLENDRPRAATCRIYDISGTLLDESRKLQIPRGYHTIDFRTEGYAPGAYFIVLESEGEAIAKEKFVIR